MLICCCCENVNFHLFCLLRPSPAVFRIIHIDFATFWPKYTQIFQLNNFFLCYVTTQRRNWNQNSKNVSVCLNVPKYAIMCLTEPIHSKYQHTQYIYISHSVQWRKMVTKLKCDNFSLYNFFFVVTVVVVVVVVGSFFFQFNCIPLSAI